MGRYVGITGFRAPQEIEKVLRIAESISERAMSPKIGYGMVFYLQNRQRALSLEELHMLCRTVDSLEPAGKAIVHLNEWTRAKNLNVLLSELAEFVPSSASIQLNRFDWELDSIGLMKKVFPHNQFILPYNPHAKNVNECVPVIERNLQNIDAILIDASEGSGEMFDIIQTANIVNNLRTSFPKLSLAIAGGLGTGSAQHLVQHLSNLAPICVDAETGMWKNGELVKENVVAYLTAMFKLCG